MSIEIISGVSITLLSGKTAAATGDTVGPEQCNQLNRTYQATVTGTGAVTATVEIHVSQNPATLGWVLLGTITLSGTTTDSDGFSSEAAWAYTKAVLTAVTGTGATVNAGLGV